MSHLDSAAKVTPAWRMLIGYAQLAVPFGDIHIKIVNGEPGELLSARRLVDFRRQDTLAFLEVGALMGLDDSGEVVPVERLPSRVRKKGT